MNGPRRIGRGIAARAAGARLLASAWLAFVAAGAGCNGKAVARADAPSIAASSPRAAVPGAPEGAEARDGVGARCVPDECSLATMRAMISAESRAARLAESSSGDPAVLDVARGMERDLREDDAILDALEARTGVGEAPCDESREAAAKLRAQWPAPGGAFDRAFVATQIAALDEMKRIVNRDLVGCASNGNVKIALRAVRSRPGDADAGASGIVAELRALRALADVADAGARAESRAPDGPAFVHPGVGVTRGQLDFIKEKLAAGAEPWAAALRRANADPRGSVDYAPHPPRAVAATESAPAAGEGVVLCGSFSDPDVHCSDEKEDAVAAYTQALLWALGGDDRHARIAIAVLDAWSTLREHRLFNAALQAAWTGGVFARAAELIETSTLWAPAAVARFKAMMRRAFLEPLQAAVPGVAPPGDPSFGQNGNWVLSVADAMIEIGVFLDAGDVFRRGVELWRDRVPAYCYLSSVDGPHPRVPAGGYGGANTGHAAVPTRTGDPYGYWGQGGRALRDGVSQETCRDLEHVQFGIAAITNGAETARIQGVDLYAEQAPRLAACLEFAAGYALRAPTDGAGRPLEYSPPVVAPVAVPAEEPGTCPDAEGRAAVVLLNAGSLADHVVQPTWEIGYNALANRLGMDMPLTRRLVVRYRAPPAGWSGATHHMAWETLTHGDVGDAGDARAALRSSAP